MISVIAKYNTSYIELSCDNKREARKAAKSIRDGYCLNGFGVNIAPACRSIEIEDEKGLLVAAWYREVVAGKFSKWVNNS